MADRLGVETTVRLVRFVAELTTGFDNVFGTCFDSGLVVCFLGSVTATDTTGAVTTAVVVELDVECKRDLKLRANGLIGRDSGVRG